MNWILNCLIQSHVFCRGFLSWNFNCWWFSFNWCWSNEICCTLSCSRNSLLFIEPENSLLCLQDWPPTWVMILYACDSFCMPFLYVCLAGCILCIDRRGVLSEAGETQTFHAGFMPPASILVTAADWLVQILQNVWLKEVLAFLALRYDMYGLYVCFCHHQSSSYFVSFCCGLCVSPWLDIRNFYRNFYWKLT